MDAGDPYRIGIGIDVFPIDNVPENEREWKRYNRFRRVLLQIYEWKFSMLFRKGRPWWKYLFLPFVKLLLLPIPIRKTGVMMDRYIKKYREANTSVGFESCLGLRAQKPFPKRLLENVVDMKFEDRVFKGMADYDEYLTICYGDWRTLPPESERINHHGFNAWWK